MTEKLDDLEKEKGERKEVKSVYSEKIIKVGNDIEENKRNFSVK